MSYLKHASACVCAVLSVVFMAGCASPAANGDKSTQASDPDDKSYLTGSRIPRKTNAESITKVSKEAFAESMRERPQGMGAGQ